MQARPAVQRVQLRQRRSFCAGARSLLHEFKKMDRQESYTSVGGLVEDDDVVVHVPMPTPIVEGAHKHPTLPTVVRVGLDGKRLRALVTDADRWALFDSIAHVFALVGMIVRGSTFCAVSILETEVASAVDGDAWSTGPWIRTDPC